HLVLIACNTPSPNALRKIQQESLPQNFPRRRVLGVIRPSAEEVAESTSVHKVGVLATESVVAARSYIIEIRNQNPEVQVFQQACPMLVPLIEAGERDWIGTDMIVKRYLGELFAEDGDIDAILLACTHYPILYDVFRRNIRPDVAILEQGPIVAKRLKDYLSRHPEIESNLQKRGMRVFLSTDKTEKFDKLARIFYGEPVSSKLVSLESICTI
ncbi:MAG: aspartate/glutamate racemase family protein, partial [Syntrophales bacterium]|nr:aspartate/glutamate racemase family protein [Syntrophales bacterium]